MASSNPPADEYLVNYREGQDPPLCRCELRAPSKLRQSWRPGNPARRFFNYGKSLGCEQSCRFFVWIDHPSNQHYKNTIDGLMREVKELTNNAEILRLEAVAAKEKRLCLLQQDHYEEEACKLQARIVELQASVVNFQERGRLAEAKLKELEAQYGKLKKRNQIKVGFMKAALLFLVAVIMYLVLFK